VSEWPRRLSLQVFGQNDPVITPLEAWKKDSYSGKGENAPTAVAEAKPVLDLSKLGHLLT